jgi:hypothetical protein
MLLIHVHNVNVFPGTCSMKCEHTAVDDRTFLAVLVPTSQWPLRIFLGVFRWLKLWVNGNAYAGVLLSVLKITQLLVGISRNYVIRLRKVAELLCKCNLVIIACEIGHTLTTSLLAVWILILITKLKIFFTCFAKISTCSNVYICPPHSPFLYMKYDLRIETTKSNVLYDWEYIESLFCPV